MRKILLFLLVIILGGVSAYLIYNRVSLEKPRRSRAEAAPAKSVPISTFGRVGEKITYDIRLGKVSLGKSVFHHLEELEFKGRPANLITFDTKLARFHDLEKIYSDPDNFLPLQVERQIKNLLHQERIIETYDQQNFILTITKVKGKKKEHFTIKKASSIHNAILLPYYVRRIPKLDIGWTLLAQLPTQRFQIKLVSIEDIRVPAGKFRSYHFESSPKKFEIWITADERRIPVKIKGTIGIGYTMVMKDYNP